MPRRAADSSLTKNCVLLIGVLFTILQIGAFCMTLNKKEEDCVNELKLDRGVIEAWNIEPEIPEDNVEVSEYMTCYWKKQGFQKANGEIDYYKIGEVIHSDLKTRFQGECLHIVAYVVDSCKNSVQADSDGLRVVRMWNCLNAYTENLF